MDENSVVDRMERLEEVSEGRLVYGETAGLKQVYRRAKFPPFEMLVQHYENSLAEVS